MAKDVNKNKKPETDAERAARVHEYFSKASRKLDKIAAFFEKKTKKDSQQFDYMCHHLNRLRNTEGFQHIDQQIAKGRQITGDFQYRVKLAGVYALRYIEYAEQKSAFELGILGRRRLNAARKLFEEIQEIDNTLLKEYKFLQDRRIKDSEPVTMTIPEHSGSKMNMNDLDQKVNGQKSVVVEQREVSGWMDVNIIDNKKQASKAAAM